MGLSKKSVTLILLNLRRPIITWTRRSTTWRWYIHAVNALKVTVKDDCLPGVLPGGVRGPSGPSVRVGCPPYRGNFSVWSGSLNIYDVFTINYIIQSPQLFASFYSWVGWILPQKPQIFQFSSMRTHILFVFLYPFDNLSPLSGFGLLVPLLDKFWCHPCSLCRGGVIYILKRNLCWHLFGHPLKVLFCTWKYYFVILGYIFHFGWLRETEGRRVAHDPRFLLS